MVAGDVQDYYCCVEDEAPESGAGDEDENCLAKCGRHPGQRVRLVIKEHQRQRIYIKDKRCMVI